MAKYERYQDYVIRDGKFIGEFEDMYRDFDDPWEQSTREQGLSYKTVVLSLLKKYKFKRILEIGCGFGYFSKEIHDLGIDTLGVDISETAVKKASALFPECNFTCGDVLDFAIYEKFKPDCIIFSEVTWYILDKLQHFLKYYKNQLKETYLIHLLAMYAKGVQKYGIEYFSELGSPGRGGVLSYFDLDYEEYGEIHYKELGFNSRTYFLGRPKSI